MSDALEQVEQLLEASIDAAVILDEDRRIVFYNRAYEAMTGLRGRQLKRRIEAGAHCYEIFPIAICEFNCLGCKAMEVDRPLRVDEILAERGDGEELTLIVSANRLNQGLIIESYRDVTADARIQRRLKVLLERERRAKEHLEEEVSARTKDLRQAQAQLVHQEKMSGLGRLVAGIAHEMNNPINFVYGNVDFLGQYMEDLLALVAMIDESELPPALRSEMDARKSDIEYDFLVEDSRKLIRSIRAGAERTASIVQDLKTFSRTGGGELQEADVVAGIETTLNLIGPLLKNRVTVERDFQPSLPRLVCNAGHINQVFMNILTNAAQAIEGNGTIRVRIRRTDEPEGIRVEITDTGAGIGAEVMEKMTDPFFTTKDVGEGTGLGLWITENIVRAHGGKLAWRNEAGSGATFTVELPIRAPETARMGLAGGRAEPPAAVPSEAERGDRA